MGALWRGAPLLSRHWCPLWVLPRENLGEPLRPVMLSEGEQKDEMEKP